MSLGLGLEIETLKTLVSDSVSKLRLEKLSLGLGLEIETLKFTVSDSVSKLRL